MAWSYNYEGNNYYSYSLDEVYLYTCIWSSCDVVCTITLREWCPIPISTGDSCLISGEIPLVTLEGHTSPFTCAGNVPQLTNCEKYERVTFLMKGKIIIKSDIVTFIALPSMELPQMFSSRLEVHRPFIPHSTITSSPLLLH